MRSPYFGRFDFLRNGEQQNMPVYIGVHHFRDEVAQETLAYDWRAPISSMFYDFETGPAHYQAPMGRIGGQLSLKRQMRIRDGELEFVLESGVNIVATIQRDQNAIIRNDDAPR